MKASKGQNELIRNDKRFPPSYPTAKPELQLWGPFLEGLAPPRYKSLSRSRFLRPGSRVMRTLPLPWLWWERSYSHSASRPAPR
jgi:hypothetical protein